MYTLLLHLFLWCLLPEIAAAARHTLHTLQEVEDSFLPHWRSLGLWSTLTTNVFLLVGAHPRFPPGHPFSSYGKLNHVRALDVLGILRCNFLTVGWSGRLKQIIESKRLMRAGSRSSFLFVAAIYMTTTRFSIWHNKIDVLLRASHCLEQQQRINLI